ncbi:hypothetical protein SNOG_05723 [Parastagonospora nodorum SN15]|uniref:Uncharacterized protein n=1 Tax=Phaeosphaeria nodorum (strain SN15 / ATCC MYA-4574 / FGSC 10173) TaxID=321614 RepID=Q0UR91_PHANO|nr:hypothetical protein SNOG_05723 [Parastagonospora nodorum SN15]EAT86787.1 hypothetical protein SNOG_05723 [Parastagonospora nodorum SN15]
MASAPSNKPTPTQHAMLRFDPQALLADKRLRTTCVSTPAGTFKIPRILLSASLQFPPAKRAEPEFLCRQTPPASLGCNVTTK